MQDVGISRKIRPNQGNFEVHSRKTLAWGWQVWTRVHCLCSSLIPLLSFSLPQLISHATKLLGSFVLMVMKQASWFPQTLWKREIIGAGALQMEMAVVSTWSIFCLMGDKEDKVSQLSTIPT